MTRLSSETHVSITETVVPDVGFRMKEKQFDLWPLPRKSGHLSPSGCVSINARKCRGTPAKRSRQWSWSSEVINRWLDSMPDAVTYCCELCWQSESDKLCLLVVNSQILYELFKTCHKYLGWAKNLGRIFFQTTFLNRTKFTPFLPFYFLTPFLFSLLPYSFAFFVSVFYV